MYVQSQLSSLGSGILSSEQRCLQDSMQYMLIECYLVEKRGKSGYRLYSTGKRRHVPKVQLFLILVHPTPRSEYFEYFCFPFRCLFNMTVRALQKHHWLGLFYHDSSQKGANIKFIGHETARNKLKSHDCSKIILHISVENCCRQSCSADMGS